MAVALKTRPILSDRESATPKRVCFVCTGNTCRSPMAEAVTNALAQKMIEAFPEAVRDAAVPPVEAFSAGLYAGEGDPIAANAVLALEGAEVPVVAGHDYHTHTAHTLMAEEIAQYDLLVGLSGSHMMELLMRFPQAAPKITCMPKPISDPFGGDLNTYQACLAEITAGVRELLFSRAPQ